LLEKFRGFLPRAIFRGGGGIGEAAIRKGIARGGIGHR
jgi:hypothetical protein